MGEIDRLDWAAMEAVAEYLEAAASDVLLVGLNWPEHDDSSTNVAIDLHVESARLWVASVIDRLEVWSERARQIADALARPRRLT
jgi:hypothetical protein